MRGTERRWPPVPRLCHGDKVLWSLRQGRSSCCPRSLERSINLQPWSELFTGISTLVEWWVSYDNDVTAVYLLYLNLKLRDYADICIPFLKDGRSALSFAGKSGHAAVVHALLAVGAQVDMKNQVIHDIFIIGSYRFYLHVFCSVFLFWQRLFFSSSSYVVSGFLVCAYDCFREGPRINSQFIAGVWCAGWLSECCKQLDDPWSWPKDWCMLCLHSLVPVVLLTSFVVWEYSASWPGDRGQAFTLQ